MVHVCSDHLLSNDNTHQREHLRGTPSHCYQENLQIHSIWHHDHHSTVLHRHRYCNHKLMSSAPSRMGCGARQVRTSDDQRERRLLLLGRLHHYRLDAGHPPRSYAPRRPVEAPRQSFRRFRARSRCIVSRSPPLTHESYFKTYTDKVIPKQQCQHRHDHPSQIPSPLQRPH